MTASTPKKGPHVSATWQERFLLSLSKYANVSAAVRVARVSRNFVYTQREADPAFAVAWDEALQTAVEGLEREAWRRAQTGVRREKGVYHKGELLATEVTTEYSDTLMIFLLKAHDPKYRDTINVNVLIKQEAARLAALTGGNEADIMQEFNALLAEVR